MKYFLFAIFLISSLAFAQQDKTLNNRALDADLILEVNDGGTPATALTVDGASSTVRMNTEKGLSGDCSAGDICSGTFTPTDTYISGAGCTAATQITPSAASFFRLGDMVFMSGNIVINPAGAGTCRFRITLPISTTVTASGDIGGSCGLVDGGTTNINPCGTEAFDGGASNGQIVLTADVFAVTDNQLNYSVAYKIQ